MISSFNPPLRTLMGPGPSMIHPRVLAAMSKPTIGHLDPEFVSLMDEIKVLLRMAFRTANDFTFPVSAPGSAGMEMCFLNLVEPGDKVIVCQNGVFGSRMAENVKRAGGECVVIETNWGEPVDVVVLENTLQQHQDAVLVAFVHAETSTGVVSDAQAIAAIAKQYECLTICDAVTSLGGIPLEVDAWGLDAVYSGSQKCLSAPPGLSPVTFNQDALDKVAKRQTPCHSWFLDINLIKGYWSGDAKRAYHHTAPVNAMYALHEALVMLQEEGLEASWERHQNMHQRLKDKLENIGLEMFVAEGDRLPQLNAVKIPEHIDEAHIRQQLLAQYGLEIGAGLGPLAGQIWRIGLMGQSATISHVDLCCAALAEVIKTHG
jgi:alanine-glyoxylate transaminase / serine-glyoxylate transaminase / serine-pyruvate transaminase